MKKQTNTVLPEFNRLCARRKKRRGGEGRGRKKPFSLLLNPPPVFLLSISPFETLGSRHSNLRSGVILFIYVFCFFASLAREEEKKKTDYTDKGRAHDRMASTVATEHSPPTTGSPSSRHVKGLD